MAALGKMPDLSVVPLGTLRPLRAESDLDMWIGLTGRAIRARGHEPAYVRARVMTEVYGGKPTTDVSFENWMGRLHSQWNKVFVEL